MLLDRWSRIEANTSKRNRRTFARSVLLSGLRDCMQRAGRQRLRFWPVAQMRGLFEPQERTSAIAMIAPLDDTAPLPERNGPTELALLDHI